MRALWIPAVLITVAGAEPLDFTRVPDAAKLRAPAVTEASGLAISSADPHFMWIINDSGGTPDIHLAETDGTSRGKTTLKGVDNIDWEDLASFSLHGKNYLLVADTGDNASKRQSCLLHILQEPTLPAAGKNLAATAVPAWQIQFQYADGPRDCEAVAVDAKAGKIILITKRTNPPQVYELPLLPSGKTILQTAQRIGQTEVRSPANSLIPFRNQPTGLDISADRSLAAVVTYYGVFLFPRQPNESWAEALAKPPAILKPHLLPQAESVTFSKDGKHIFLTSEGTNSSIRIYRFQESINPRSSAP
ncbi:MAG TPA: hypothetical protein VF258_05305 [Luteolibacter sp.]